MLKNSLKKSLFAIFLSLVLLIASVSLVIASKASEQDESDIIIDQTIVSEFIDTLSQEDWERNPYLVDTINDLLNLVNKEKKLSLSKVQSYMGKKDSYKNHIKERAKINEDNRINQLSELDVEQFERIDLLAKEYYTYYEEHGVLPFTSETQGEVTVLSSVSILGSIGLSFTEGSLATRLATLGIVAALDGPLPVLDFIALVGAAVVIGIYAANYVASTTVETAIANNIGTYEGITFKNEATSSLSQTRTLVYTNSAIYKHFVASPKNYGGGGIHIGSAITFSAAALRANLDLDTYSYYSNDAYNVALSATSAGYSPTLHPAHNTTNQPLNKIHFHATYIGVVTKAHHWYG